MQSAICNAIALASGAHIGGGRVAAVLGGFVLVLVAVKIGNERARNRAAIERMRALDDERETFGARW